MAGPSHDDICTVTFWSDDIIKYKLLTKQQKIAKGFSFPQQQFGTKPSSKPHMRSFSLKWLDEFGPDGLCYSVYEDAAYCKFCRLFPGGERGLLVEKPFQRWKDAISKFNAHFCNIISDKTKGYSGNKLHLHVVKRATEFVRQIEGKNLPIAQVMDETSRKQVMKNKAAIKSIAQTVYFLARQGLPLRGHRDDSKHLEDHMNCGNFQELLQFQLKQGTRTSLHTLKVATEMQLIEVKQFKIS